MLNAPVCTTVSGKGTLPDAHPLNVGVVGTNGGVPLTREVVMQADLVLFVGARAGSTTTEHWKFPARDVPIVHIDVDAMTIGTNYRTDVALVGDALLALTDLNEAVRARLKHRPADAADGRAIAGKARARRSSPTSPHSPPPRDAPIKPERVVDSLNRHLPARAILVADPGTPCPYFSAYFDAPQAGRHFITNRAHGALGFAMSAGVGALVRPARRDGGRGDGRRQLQLHLRRAGDDRAPRRAAQDDRLLQHRLRLDQGEPEDGLRGALLLRGLQPHRPCARGGGLRREGLARRGPGATSTAPSRRPSPTTARRWWT